MNRRAALVVLVLLVQAGAAVAEPIIKPKKYHGPIPQQSFTLRIGFLGGADNTEMIEALDKDIKQAEDAYSNDFGNGLSIDGTYTYKIHPQFALCANVNASFLRTTGNGTFVPDTSTLPDSVARLQLDYTRDFDVDLFVLEGSALYYFSDAAIQEFQPYFGGGFSIGVPHAKFKEARVDHDTGLPYEEIDRDRWSFEPGVHGILGASYYVTNVWSANVEGRVQILQSKFPIDVYDPEANRMEQVDVIVKYNGFMINFGVSRAF